MWGFERADPSWNRVTGFAGTIILALALALAGCGGGSGGGGGKTGSGILYPGAVSLVDGQVGDSPFSDDGGSSGLADGRNLEQEGAAPVTVEWDPVMLQLDQSPVTQLAGYRIYLGHQPGNYDHVVELGDPSAASYRFAGLPQGTYYFAVSAVDGDNREGPLSSAAAVSVD